MSDEFITREEYDKFKRAVIKKLKLLEGMLDDAFEKMSEDDDRFTQLTDEAIDRAARAERAVRRLKKELE